MGTATTGKKRRERKSKQESKKASGCWKTGRGVGGWGRGEKRETEK
jgi:hypothetical protein